MSCLCGSSQSSMPAAAPAQRWPIGVLHAGLPGRGPLPLAGVFEQPAQRLWRAALDLLEHHLPPVHRAGLLPHLMDLAARCPPALGARVLGSARSGAAWPGSSRDALLAQAVDPSAKSRTVKRCRCMLQAQDAGHASRTCTVRVPACSLCSAQAPKPGQTCPGGQLSLQLRAAKERTSQRSPLVLDAPWSVHIWKIALWCAAQRVRACGLDGLAVRCAAACPWPLSDCALLAA